MSGSGSASKSGRGGSDGFAKFQMGKWRGLVTDLGLVSSERVGEVHNSVRSVQHGSESNRVSRLDLTFPCDRTDIVPDGW
jgi:hypothetical protein